MLNAEWPYLHLTSPDRLNEGFAEYFVECNFPLNQPNEQLLRADNDSLKQFDTGFKLEPTIISIPLLC